MSFVDFVKRQYGNRFNEARKVAGGVTSATGTAATKVTGGAFPEFGLSEKISGTPNPDSYPAATQYWNPSDPSAVKSMGTQTFVNGLSYNPYTPTDYSAAGGYGTTDPSATYKANIRANWQSLNDIYNKLFGDVDNQVTEKTNEFSKQFDTQLDDLNRGYQNTVGQTGMMYAARGLGDSSYLGDANAQNADIYNRSVNDLTEQKSNALAGLGTYAANTKANYSKARDQYSQYMNMLDQMDAQGLSSLDSQLTSSVSDANTARSNFMTDPQKIAELNKIVPIQQQGTQQLAGRLQTLLTSGAPAFAKKQIAQGLIRTATLGDENARGYWSQYFDDLLRTQGA